MAREIHRRGGLDHGEEVDEPIQLGLLEEPFRLEEPEQKIEAHQDEDGKKNKDLLRPPRREEADEAHGADDSHGRGDDQKGNEPEQDRPVIIPGRPVDHPVGAEHGHTEQHDHPGRAEQGLRELGKVDAFQGEGHRMQEHEFVGQVEGGQGRDDVTEDQ